MEGLLTETKNKEEEKKTLTDECRKLRKAYDGKIMKMDEFRSKIRSKMSDRQQLKKSLDDVERYFLICKFFCICADLHILFLYFGCLAMISCWQFFTTQSFYNLSLVIKCGNNCILLDFVVERFILFSEMRTN